MRKFRTTITIRVDQSLRDALVTNAKSGKESMSEVVRRILKIALVERPLVDGTGRTRGSLRIAKMRPDWQCQIRERNWRP